MVFVCLFQLIEELVRARDLKFGMGVENGVSRNKFKYLSKRLNICCCLHDFHIFTCYCMESGLLLESGSGLYLNTFKCI